MTGYLLDTNVVSELTKPQPHPGAREWLSAADDCYLSVLTLGEIERGVWLLREREPARADAIHTWLDQLRHDYADRVLPVDAAVASVWAQRPTLRTVAVVDALIAATAIAHGLTLATRNTADFTGLGAMVINPFE